jgi:dihydroflavonol-4-reductase
MRVLVTGGTGFLGGRVVEQLRAEGHEVAVLVRPGRPTGMLAPDVEILPGDLLDEPSLRRACRGAEGVVHCAVMQVFWSRLNGQQRQTIVEGTAALLRATHAAKVRRFVHVSSIATIGVSRDGSLLDETSRWMGTDLGIYYVTCKREAEERALAAARGGVPVVVVNPGAMMGPRSATSLPWHLRRMAYGRARWAPHGGSSFLDVEDAARSVVAALLRGRVGERYILGGHNLTWIQLHEAVARYVGRKIRVLTIPRIVRHGLVAGTTMLDAVRLSRPPYTPEFFRLWGWYAYMDSSKAARELDHSVRPIEDTLSRYCWDAEGASATNGHARRSLAVAKAD